MKSKKVLQDENRKLTVIEKIVSASGGITLIPTFLGAFLSPVVTKKIGVKKNLVLSSIITIVTTAVTLFIPATSGGWIAFVVRMTFVLAVMILLGRKAWYMPKWLDKILPKIDLEGETINEEEKAV